MKRLIAYDSLIVAACLASAHARTAPLGAQHVELKGFASLFDVAAGAVRDTNGDGLADSVAARVIVPAEPTTEDVQAAASIAGRLGFETTALTLPIVVRAGDISQAASVALPILVGRTNPLTKTLIDRGAIDVKPLKPGQGLLAVVQAPFGGGDGIVVIGGDDEGTLNAGNALAAYLPRLWGATGARVGQVEAQTIRYLKSAGITATSRGVSSIVVDSDRRGVARVTLRVETPQAEAARVMQAIEQLDLAHRRGQ